jgi:hypothetical protein
VSTVEDAMWRCTNCNEEVGEEFNACWSCGTGRDGTPNPTFQKVQDAPQEEPEYLEGEVRHPIACARCERQLTFIGTKKLHEGTRAWDVLGGLWELFKNREHFDVYMCPRCGRVEFFVDGVGEAFRPH